MSETFVRPRVADLIFRLYDRSIHPELFDTLACRRVRRDGWVLTARVTPMGHVLEWVGTSGRLTEVTTAAGLDLPERGCRLRLRFDGERRGRYDVAADVRYQVEVQAEVLPPEVFVQVHEELAADGARRGLLFHFRPQHRLGLTPLGLVSVEAVPSGLAIAAFHTFPEEFTVVKTQSLIEFGGDA